MKAVRLAREGKVMESDDEELVYTHLWDVMHAVRDLGHFWVWVFGL